ncbi:uncharacterized protein LOC107048831 [Diachasma alloeum]|uniref:uncharacterized protein LOC107048831 n=1 Tax=Diachasma alloeum TaxID=454923 RepID=UPI00073841E0|nr:uncharacterized protein LOC107048831 [Diachasma alloeum]
MKNCDMAVQKRQYYDSVLNFQRAKAVTNPLAPMPSTSTYDSSYYEYLQQQQWIYQHQQRLIMGHQYAQRLVQTEFSAPRNPYGRSTEWMSHCTTSRHSQEAYGIPSNVGYYDTNYHPDYEGMSQTNNPESSKAQQELKSNLLQHQNPK